MRSHISSHYGVLQHLISLGLIFNLFLMRPSALGQSLSWVAIVLSTALVGAHFTFAPQSQRFTNSQLRSEMIALFGFLSAYWLYIGPISTFFNQSDLEFTLKDLVTTALIAIPYAIYLVDERANRAFFRKFCTVVSLLGLSCLVTTILTLCLGSRDPLFLFAVDVKGYTEHTPYATAQVGDVYFPLSMLYMDFVSGTVRLDRYCAFFREAGIYQAVACFFLAYEMFTRRSWFVVVGLLSGVIFSFSSLGTVLIATTIGLIFLFGTQRFRASRAVIAALFISLAYPAAIYTPYIGLNDKGITHAESLSDRFDAIARSIDTVSKNPLGYGLFSSKVEIDGICLLARLGEIGIFGFLCHFLILSGWRPGPHKSWRKVAACVPLLATALLSEPIAGEPMINIIIMAYIPYVRRQARAMQPAAPLGFKFAFTQSPSISLAPDGRAAEQVIGINGG
jgi:hypothetical protein